MYITFMNGINYIFPSRVTLGLVVTKKPRLLLLLSSRSVSYVIFLVECTPCIFMCRWNIFVFMDLYRCFLINPPVRPGHVLRKPCLVDLIRLVFVGINSAA